jgi:hypothetical protein
MTAAAAVISAITASLRRKTFDPRLCGCTPRPFVAIFTARFPSTILLQSDIITSRRSLL